MPLSNDWNKERLETLKQMFPDLFTNEGKLNIDELKKMVDPQSMNETERFEFKWFGKSQAKRNAFTPSNATLVYDDTRSLNPTESENLIIEGENLEVLKLLSGSYREKIKCIYIDPPYNTGKDFVYTDNFSQDKKSYWENTGVLENGLKIDTNTESDGRYHSNWLNMMYSRLLIARALLKPDGVIFISIDDHELHHLRKLCDEVFGEENFIANIVWTNKEGGGSSDSSYYKIKHEYIVCYSKCIDHVTIFGEIQEEDESYNAEDEFKNERGKYKLIKLNSFSIQYSDLLNYPITTTSGEIIVPSENGKKGCWRWSKKKYEWGLKNGFIVIKKGQEGLTNIYTKQYFKVDNENRPMTRTLPPPALIDEYSSTMATKQLDQLFGEKCFDYSKPYLLINKLIKNISKDKDIILDFFAGSGTTGQAVMELNKRGCNCKFILVQIPEAIDEKSEAFKAGYKKISDITIERNKRVIEKIMDEKKKQQPELFTHTHKNHKENTIKGLGFKVFKLVKSNFPRVAFAPDPEKTDKENIVLLKKYIADKEVQLLTLFNRDEVMTEILLKKGFSLNYKTKKQSDLKKNEVILATDGEKEILICLDRVINIETVAYFKKNVDKKFICLECALDTTKKYNLKHYLDDQFNPF